MVWFGTPLMLLAIVGVSCFGFFSRKNLPIEFNPGVWLLSLFLLMSLFSTVNKRIETMTQSRGDRIALALEKYREEKGYYPFELQDLTPKYLPRIPTPLYVGTVFDYRAEGIDVSTGFNLTYPAYGDGMNWFQYNLNTKKWEDVDY